MTSHRIQQTKRCRQRRGFQSNGHWRVVPVNRQSKSSRVEFGFLVGC